MRGMCFGGHPLGWHGSSQPKKGNETSRKMIALPKEACSRSCFLGVRPLKFRGQVVTLQGHSQDVTGLSFDPEEPGTCVLRLSFL